MIISCVVGGLGNQLFQYYTGLSIARRLNRRLYAEISSTLAPQCRPYLLGDFGLGPGINLENEETRAAMIRVFRLHSRNHGPEIEGKELFRKVVERSSSFYCEEVFTEVAGTFICLLEGYWHTAQYFADLPDTEFALLKMSTAASDRRYEALLAAAQKPEECCVAVHIRRGDMTRQQQIYQLVPFSFYQESIVRILTHIPDARFFLFCDDWSDPVISPIETLLGSRGLRADQKDLSDADVFRVMARCQNHLLANSTFSWWAAYLAERLQPAHRLTIAPRRWHVDEGYTNRDLLPSHWIKI